ncbi:MAG: thiamine-monophosphate kinase [Candidatus Omnitrophica bacterium]|nr:thiamine-monophosphate kinase [Candidatus Omnitrophota bacterium]
MKLNTIGEFGFIERLAKGIRPKRSVVKGIGDDAAVLPWMRDKHLLATSDMLIEGAHFKKTQPPEKIGWKAVCCGVSDIAAMGGLPKWALVSCGLPKDLPVKYADGIYRGIKKAAKCFSIDLVGGDTNRSKKIILEVVLLGEVKKKNLVLRSGAEVGDFIFVTGSLGGSIYGRHLNFVPRLKEAQTLVSNFKVNSMIDLSDGLSSDLNHIVKQSKVGAAIYKELIPKSKKARGVEGAISDGEDFELLFTMPKSDAFRLLDLKHKLFGIPITRIGTVTDKEFGTRIIDIFGGMQAVRPKGFRHF